MMREDTLSEYQYYEFQAIDRPLTEREIRALRAFSTRARITPTSFVNSYDWGDFKGDPRKWMESTSTRSSTSRWVRHAFHPRLWRCVLDSRTARHCLGEVRRLYRWLFR